MSQAQVVLLVPLGDFGGIAGQLPAYGGGHPSHGLPGSPGHVAPPIALPPHVWPPSHIGSWRPGTKPSHPIQPPTSGTKPLPPGSPLPAGSSLVLVYNAESGWQGAVVDQGGTTKPIEPSEPAPTPTT